MFTAEVGDGDPRWMFAPDVHFGLPRACIPGFGSAFISVVRRPSADLHAFMARRSRNLLVTIDRRRTETLWLMVSCTPRQPFGNARSGGDRGRGRLYIVYK